MCFSNFQTTFLKTFDCACFPLLRPYNNHKLDFRSHECLFLGYSTSYKGYKCLSPFGRNYISKDVIFNESKFPYADLFKSPSLSQSVSVSVQPPSVSVQSDSDLPQSDFVQLSNSVQSDLPQSVSVQSFNPEQTDQPTVYNTVLSSNSESSSSTTNSPSPPRPSNIHPMQTRSKSGIHLPRINPSLLLAH